MQLEKMERSMRNHIDKLVLSTWFITLQILNIPGKDLENVQFVKLYQHAEDVIKKLENKEFNNIVVVGAGYIGVELAEAFQRIGKNVELIDLADSCLSGYYDKEFRDLMNKNLADNGINLNYGEKVLEIKGNGKVEEVITDKNHIKLIW